MTLSTPLPSLETAKSQAKRLRASLARHGEDIGHSKALELISHQLGFKDWNTMSAAIGDRPPAPYHVGMTVRGRYLGQAFSGEILSVSTRADGRWRLTLNFDQPIDVVRFESFSAFRRRVSATVDRHGVSREKTSDGVPHIMLLDIR